MQTNNKANKCVVVIDAELSIGLITNTAAILGISLGHKNKHLIGQDVFDGSGHHHVGLVAIPVPILKGTKEQIKALKEKALTDEFSDIIVVDFSDAAQTSFTYEAYIEKISSSTTEDLQYLGIAFYGDSKKVNKLTGNMPLLK